MAASGGHPAEAAQRDGQAEEDREVDDVHLQAMLDQCLFSTGRNAEVKEIVKELYNIQMGQDASLWGVLACIIHAAQAVQRVPKADHAPFVRILSEGLLHMAKIGASVDGYKTEKGKTVVEELMLQSISGGLFTLEEGVKTQHPHLSADDYLELRVRDAVNTAAALSLLNRTLLQSPSHARVTAAKGVQAALELFVCKWGPTLDAHGVLIGDIRTGMVHLKEDCKWSFGSFQGTSLRLAMARMNSSGRIGKPSTTAEDDAAATLRVFERACQVAECAVPDNQLPGVDSELLAVEQTQRTYTGADTTNAMAQMVAELLPQLEQSGRQIDADLIRALKRPRRAA